jgi:hypothetical protein
MDAGPVMGKRSTAAAGNWLSCPRSALPAGGPCFREPGRRPPPAGRRGLLSPGEKVSLGPGTGSLPDAERLATARFDVPTHPGRSLEVARIGTTFPGGWEEADSSQAGGSFAIVAVRCSVIAIGVFDLGSMAISTRSESAHWGQSRICRLAFSSTAIS